MTTLKDLARVKTLFQMRTLAMILKGEAPVIPNLPTPTQKDEK